MKVTQEQLIQSRDDVVRCYIENGDIAKYRKFFTKHDVFIRFNGRLRRCMGQAQPYAVYGNKRFAQKHQIPKNFKTTIVDGYESFLVADISTLQLPPMTKADYYDTVVHEIAHCVDFYYSGWRGRTVTEMHAESFEKIYRPLKNTWEIYGSLYNPDAFPPERH